MKTSSGLLLGVLFTLVVVIVAVVIYFNTRPEEEKPKTVNDPGPSPTLPSITDLNVSRTFSPNGSESYTIEPYTIEPYTTEDVIALSKNVSFTLTWKNGSGFDESGVTKIRVYHIIENSGQETKTILRNDTASTLNYESVSVTISGLDTDTTAADDTTGPYSFVGTNFFKIVAVTPAGTDDVTLYDGQSNTGDGKPITDDDLVGTIDMANSETITFTPRLDNTQGRSIGKSISNKRYDFYYYETKTAESATLIFSNMRLVPNDLAGTKFKLEKKDGSVLKGVEENGRNVFQFQFITAATIPMIVHISESTETDKKDHDKVIMLKQIIGGVDYYLFGDHFDLLGSKTNSDDFFRRNIYITESTS
jgi:hypothetical protein|tara:strand:- start:1807 stop:2895 length:1089 start_codon:yes stop_codon:yes gene_type:complete